MIVFGSAMALLLLAGVLYQFVGLRISERRYAPPGAMISVDGQHLHVHCAGTGQPLVLFESGIAASSLSWARVLPEVATFTRACSYDRAGLGWSAPSRAPRTVSRMLRDLQGVVEDRAEAGSVVLVGHSFGALLVCVYASANPGGIAGLVLVDPPIEWHEMTAEQVRLLWGGIHLSRIGALLARVGVVRACLALLTGGAPGVPRNFVRIFGPTAARTLERLVGEVRKLPADVLPVVQALWCQPKCFHAMAGHLAALEDTAAAASRVTSLGAIPLVILSAGDQPPDIIAKHGALTRLSSDSRHLVASGSGHWIQFDEPALVVDAVRDLIERVRRTRGSVL
jgi:pimeloyl-ACP methyl ester carboxylesterase